MIRKALVCLVSLGVILAASHVRAQRVILPELKAAYLLNFMKFIEWPADRPRPSPVVLCVVGDDELLKILQQLTKGRTLGDAPYQVRPATIGEGLRSCQLVYAARLDAESSAAVVQALKGAPVLSISDHTGFAQMGGIANFYVESDRLRFAINLDAARRAQLQISARLMGVATVVKDQGEGVPP